MNNQDTFINRKCKFCQKRAILIWHIYPVCAYHFTELLNKKQEKSNEKRN